LRYFLALSVTKAYCEKIEFNFFAALATSRKHSRVSQKLRIEKPFHHRLSKKVGYSGKAVGFFPSILPN
jgi:hypothetical protein